MRGDITTKAQRSASHLAIAGAAMALISAALPAAAQTAPTREEILREPTTGIPATNAPQIDTEDGIERAPCPLANPEFSSIRFTLSAVEWSNLGPIDPALLAPAWSGKVGQELPVAEICEIRDQAATILRRAGYLAAVRVPVQTIENGVVRLDILAARLVSVQVRGDAGNNEAQLARYLRNLEGRPIFNTRDAERYLLLAGTIPGLSTRMTLRPGGAPGKVVGEVTVSRTPAFIDSNIQNYGSRSAGRWGGIARLRVNGLTGLGDETIIGAYATSDFDKQQVLQGGHSFHIGGEGLRLASNVTYAWARPELAGGLDFRSQTLVWTTDVRYPLILRQSQQVYAGAGFDWVDQDAFVAGVPLTQDHLRVLWARIDGNWQDEASTAGRNRFSPAEPNWSMGVSLEARQGIDGLSASPDCRTNTLACFTGTTPPPSRVEANPAATVLRGSAQLVWRPIPEFTIAILPRAQYSADPVLIFEEFSAGNFTVGRGYDPGILTGDSGLGVSYEARLGSLIPPNRRDIAIQPYLFADVARVWNEDTSFAGVDRQTLVSLGGGARIAYGDVLQIDLTVASPRLRTFTQTKRGDLRFLVSLTTQFGIRR
jgi:hemolysin activation/secretion protein